MVAPKSKPDAAPQAESQWKVIENIWPHTTAAMQASTGVLVRHTTVLTKPGEVAQPGDYIESMTFVPNAQIEVVFENGEPAGKKIAAYLRPTHSR